MSLSLEGCELTLIFLSHPPPTHTPARGRGGGGERTWEQKMKGTTGEVLTERVGACVLSLPHHSPRVPSPEPTYSMGEGQDWVWGWGARSILH